MLTLILLNLRRILTRRTLLILFVLLLMCAFLLFYVLDKTRDNESKNPLFEPVNIALSSSEEDSYYFKILAQAIQSTSYIKNSFILTKSDAIRQVESRQIFGAIYFPQGFFDQAMSGSYDHPIEIYLGRDASLEASFIYYLSGDFSQAIERTQALAFSYYDWLVENNLPEEEALQHLNNVAKVLVASLINTNHWIAHSDHLLLDTLRYLVMTFMIIIGFLISLLVGQIMQQDRLSERVEHLTSVSNAYLRNTVSQVGCGLILDLFFLLPITVLTRNWFNPYFFFIGHLSLALFWLLLQQFFLQVMRRPMQASITHIMMFVLTLLLGGQVYPLNMFPPVLSQLRFVSPSYYTAQFSQHHQVFALPILLIGLVVLGLTCYQTRQVMKGART